jgi:hypothetical protein
MRLRFRVLLICMAAGFALPVCAQNDLVQFGSTIRVAPGESVHDTVCFFCGVDNRGTVNGDIVVFFGDVHLAGEAHHDVVDFFGSVRADDNSSIGQDLVNFFGSVHLGENVSVGKDMVSMFGSFHSASTAHNGGDRVIQPAWLFWGPLLGIILVIYFVAHEYRGYRRRQFYLRYPMPPPPPPRP